MTDFRNVPHAEQPALVFARRDLRGKDLEVSNLWYGSMRNMPADHQLIKPKLSRPFMNFKEARNQLAEVLGREPNKIRFMAFKGQRTWYPKNSAELEMVIEHIDPAQRRARLMQENVFAA